MTPEDIMFLKKSLVKKIEKRIDLDTLKPKSESGFANLVDVAIGVALTEVVNALVELEKEKKK